MEAKEAAAAALPLDRGQIKKASQALLAYIADKQKSGDKVLLDVDQNVFLMVTVWKIPPEEQVIKINLPHSILPATSEVCLFTKDEPGLTAEQTENLYRKLLVQHGITCITEVISYKTFKTEYKPFEAKRRLLSRFALFLSDDRIRRLLPSHMGKHFYLRKKAPQCVNLKAKDLAKEINKRIQGTILPVTNKGSCYMVRVGHTGMEASEITENVMAVATAVAIKAPQIWKSVKLLHLKTAKSVALPVFNSAPHGDAGVQKKTGAEKQAVRGKKKKSKAKPRATDQMSTKVGMTGAAEVDKPKADGEEPSALKSKEEEEEIPQLVPVEISPAVEEEQVAKLRLRARNELKTGSPNLRSNRKTGLSAEAPVPQSETLGAVSPLKKSKQLQPGQKSKIPKQEFLEKMPPKRAQQPLAKPAVTPKRLKAPESDKKSKTPKRELRKMKVPLSL
ncbi:ribosomal L1 domain-containing protein 1 [Python bivittatus]|uniref:Ribosomal L1 domain-containing protein 1 n=1 Tax=Python bivittatus TaxID=176946 RepID=A0A9F2KTW3_PYTBI|nr:ribosomal L1 domain-containing protein 1 [Python bivittatus]